jgi:hypothetical protein
MPPSRLAKPAIPQFRVTQVVFYLLWHRERMVNFSKTGVQKHPQPTDNPNLPSVREIE